MNLLPHFYKFFRNLFLDENTRLFNRLFSEKGLQI